MPADQPQAAPATLSSSALVTRLGPEVSVLDLEVVATTDITPTMRRIRCTAASLATFAYRPGQDLMLAVPTPSGETFRRRYTIRALAQGVPGDQTTPTLDLDVVLHGDGPAAAWAATARPGDRIEAIGPRGKVIVDPTADWHLFAGDDSAVPASLAMAESRPSTEQAIVVLEVDGVLDQQTALAADGQEVQIRWLHRAGADPASGANLVAALDTVELPEGHGHAYLAGELGVVAEMRNALLARGLSAEQISAKPYWRAGRANAAHGEPERP